MMNTELTLNALQSMNAQEYEEIRAAGTGDVDQATGIITESGETGQLCGA